MQGLSPTLWRRSSRDDGRVPRRALFGVLGLGAGFAAWSIGAASPAFSFLGTSWVDQVALLGAGWTLVAASIVFATRHPGNAVAPILIGVAIGWFVAEFDSPGVDSTFVFTAGLLLATSCPAIVTWLMFSYPSGRVDGWVEGAAVIAAVVAAVLVGVLPALWLRPATLGCTSCAENLIAVWDDPGTVAATTRVGLRVASMAAILAIAVAGWRLLRSSPAHRRLDAPIIVPASVYLAVVAWTYVRSIERGFIATGPVERRLWLAQAAALSALAFGIVFEEIRVRRMRSAIARIVVRLDESASQERISDTLARVLSTSDVDVVYPIGDGRHVDADGEPVSLPPTDGRVTTTLIAGSRTVGVLVHRPGLLDDSVVVGEIAASVQLALENERLRAELRAQEHELQASRARIVAAGDAERRRLERDIHDGAQQRLVGLLLSVRLAQTLATRRADASAATPQHLDQMADDLQHTIDELRRIADSIHPAILTDGGLRPAIDCLADTAPLTVGSMPAERFPTAIENAAYRVVAEAAGTGPTHVAAERRAGVLVLDLATASRPEALVDLEDRIGAVNGSISVGGSTAAGVSLHVELPCG
jgi:signal transduction histidine kinase